MSKDKEEKIIQNNSKVYPLVPLRDTVMLPGMVTPIFVGRQKSIIAIETAEKSSQLLIFVAQKTAASDDPKSNDIYEIGVLGKILQLLKLPDGTIKVLAEAKRRVKIKDVIISDSAIFAETEDYNDPLESPSIDLEATSRAVLDNFAEYVQLNQKINPEILSVVNDIKDPEELANSVAGHLTIEVSKKQEILSTLGIQNRLEKIIFTIENEINVLQTEKKIRQRVKKQMEKTQKDYYLNEQMKAIQKELTETEGGKSEFEEIDEKIAKTKLSQEASDKIKSELKKLKMMNGISAEASIIRNYIDTILSLPWGINDEVKHDLKFARSILDKDHYGLDKVKDRILEYLAVQQRKNSLKGPILCFVGPPGVGKTSLAKSIAEATGRKFVRFAMGGMRDEAEIRGHRKTYVGAMPGKIIQLLKKSKSSNPVFLLDEVDKLSFDYRGDPASALLEVLDPEQNNKFADHYLEVEYDLSNVFFIATANNIQNIPRPLLDRMEIIRLSGYTEEEKVQIAMKYLVSKQMSDNGLRPEELKISSEIIREIITYYTREAGVRGLEKEIAKISRKIVKQIIEDKQLHQRITHQNLKKYLGVRKFNINTADQEDLVGIVNGLAYTEVGGDILSIEAVVLPGKGEIKTTGKLGEVMQESAKAAFSYFKSRSIQYGITPPYYQKKEIHLHVPEGAVPKDGPSAGCAMFTAIVSAMTGIPIDKTIAMTGEITLRGRILPIGGLKEKLLAAVRGGIKTAIIPFENKKDFEEISKDITKKLKIVFASTAEEVLKIALIRPLTPIIWDENKQNDIFLEKKDGDDVLTH